MTIYNSILSDLDNGKKLLAVLIDPEKVLQNQLEQLISIINKSIVTHIFVGGSTDKNSSTKSVVIEIKKHTKLPVVLFPGNESQITHSADGILFLSLLSGTNPEYLITQQVKAVTQLKSTNLEIIPTGYLLIDGGKKTAVEKISKTQPIPQNDISTIVNTALAGQYLGKKLIYLEAGSGAKFPIKTTIIKAVKNELKIPLIVGGGIKNVTQIKNAYKAGADIVVIGTAFENNPNFFTELQNKNNHENIG